MIYITLRIKVVCTLYKSTDGIKANIYFSWDEKFLFKFGSFIAIRFLPVRQLGLSYIYSFDPTLTLSFSIKEMKLE